MKKELIILFIFLFTLYLPLAHSQNSSPPNSSSISLDKINSVGNVSGLTQTTNDALEKEVKIPENLQLFAKIIFGLTDEVTFQVLIISIAVWLFLLIFLHSLLDIMPFFSGWKSWLGGVLVMILIGISGGLTLAIQVLMDFSHIFGALSKNSILSLIFSLIFIAIVSFIMMKLSHFIKSKWGIEENEIIGRNVRYAGDMGQIQREAFDQK
jgi:hypothetical protein